MEEPPGPAVREAVMSSAISSWVLRWLSELAALKWDSPSTTD